MIDTKGDTSAGLTEVCDEDLRALLWWASVGVARSKGGSYEDDIINIIESYAEHLKFQIDKPQWGKEYYR